MPLLRHHGDAGAGLSAAAATGLDHDGALFECDAVADFARLNDGGVRISAVTIVSADDWQVLGEAFQLLDQISYVHGRTIAHIQRRASAPLSRPLRETGAAFVVSALQIAGP